MQEVKKSLEVEKINIFQTLFHNVCGHTEKKVGIHVVFTVSTRRVTNSTVVVCIVVNRVGNVTQVYCFVF